MMLGCVYEQRVSSVKVITVSENSVLTFYFFSFDCHISHKQFGVRNNVFFNVKV
jgi:hypothetical protein